MQQVHLAIECSGTGAEIAWCKGARVLREKAVSPSVGTVQSLSPAIRELLQGERPERISVTVGPGSFTGLRVGLATAKLLAYGWKCPVAGVDSLHAIARAITLAKLPAPAIVVPVLNAFRRQVYTAAWYWGEEGWIELAPSQAVDAAQWQASPVDSLHPCGKRDERSANIWEHRDQYPVQLIGPGLDNYPTARSAGDVTTANREFWRPRASSVAEIGWEIHQRDRAVTAMELMPNYIRHSAAYEQLQAKRSISQ